MSKRLILVLALAMVFGLTLCAYAEVQNVKVSGDLAVSGVSRTNFDLNNSNVTGDKENDTGSFFMSQLRVRVDADLTDNVSTTVRLINERVWDAEDTSNSVVDVDLAYATLKEFLYSPLTVTVGRQELIFGNQLVIGTSGTYSRDVLNGVPKDLGIRKAFDAIRATLNYDPLIVDVFFAKMNETLILESASPVYRNEDDDLFGVNARYAVDKDTSAEAYMFTKYDRDTDSSTIDKNNTVCTYGALLTNTSFDNLKASIEAAMQLGKYRGATATNTRNSWALQAMVDYAIPKVKWSPVLGFAYTHLSGGKEENNKDAWDAMYSGQVLNNITYAIIPFSNLNVYSIKGTIKPWEDITVKANYGYYRLDEKLSAGALTMTDPYTHSSSSWTMRDKKDLGNAIDLTAIYDYTEDVQIALTTGWFKSGKAFNLGANKSRRDAAQVIGSMKVTF